ncbi:group II intron reverse transcriptase/maturase [Frankia sp. Mgl5]|nr:group II intron reverse transcriptase/maturase [Frankia sp. Mgl5]
MTRHADGVDSVRALQRVLYRCAKSDPDRRFHALYCHVVRDDVLWRAWHDVRSNRGAPGVDDISIDDVERLGVGEYLHGIAADLRAGCYRPAVLRRVEIPKSEPGKTRPLSIPTVRDRIVMTAAKLVLEPIFEAQFLPVSHGFRPGRSPLGACEAIRAEVYRGRTWVFDTDVADCFGSLDRRAVMSQVERRVSDHQILRLIRAWLKIGVLDDGVVTDRSTGVPQGSPISPLLANAALHLLDEQWTALARRTGILIRFADDLVVLAATEKAAHNASVFVAKVLRRLGLSLHRAKTRIVNLRAGAGGFDFLGWHHRMVCSWRWHGRWYYHRWPSARAMRAIRTKVRQNTGPDKVGRPLAATVAVLNPILRGWNGYFRHGNSSRQLAAVDRYVHMRLAILSSRKHQQTGRGWGRRHDPSWLSRLGVYRLSGTTRRVTTYA